MKQRGFRKVLEEAVTIAGEYAFSHWEDATPLEKEIPGGADKKYQEEKSAFSEIDSQTQKILMKIISKNLGGLPMNLIAEESNPELESLTERYFHGKGFCDSRLALILDPIDGSRNFLSANPNSTYYKDNFWRSKFWGVSACITQGKNPLTMAIYYPAMNIVLSSEKGDRTIINGEYVEIEEKDFDETDFIRISGSVNNATELRGLFLDDSKKTPRSLVTTILSMLPGEHLEKNDLIKYNAYVGENTTIYDLAGLPLAYTNAGGIVVGSNLQKTNPFEETFEKEGILRQKEMFVMAPSKKCAEKILQKIKSCKDEN